MRPGDRPGEGERARLEGDRQGWREAERRLREAAEPPTYEAADDGAYQRHFTDRRGRDIALRVEYNEPGRMARVEAEQHAESRHLIHVRAYDSQVADSPPQFKGKGQLGYANPTIEISRDLAGGETQRRLRLGDIKTEPAHQGNGIGDEMLREVERIAHQWGVREVYGTFGPEAGQEAATREFYRRRGYAFRPLDSGGEEVYKTLDGGEAAALRRALARR